MPEDEHREEAKAANETDVELGCRVRFPCARVAVGVVGILLSVWLWVGESWRFDVTPLELVEGSPGRGWRGGWVGRYVRLAAELDDLKEWQTDRPHGVDFTVSGTGGRLQVHRVAKGLGAKEAKVFAGRVSRSEEGDVGVFFYCVDTTRGRWTGKSVLAVFIFLWGAGIVGSSIWLWKKRREAAATAASTDHASSEG